MIQTILLLKTALALLTLVATSPVQLPQSVKDNAILVSNQAIAYACQELAKSPQTQQNGLIYTPPVQNQPIVNTPTGSAPSEPLLTQQNKTMLTQDVASLEIINPLNGKGLGPKPDSYGTDRGYVAYDWDYLNSTPSIADNERPKGFTFPDESNIINIGLVCRDEKGNPVNKAVVTVEATDSTQNKTIHGTGNVTKIRNAEGEESSVHYYPFNYQFKTAGEHTITFTCNGISESVTVTVVDPAK